EEILNGDFSDGTTDWTAQGNSDIEVGFFKGRENVAKINKLYEEGNEIIYYTARGTVTGIDWLEITKSQLKKWGCKYHKLDVGNKPDYDLLICDKTKRIEEI
ncbi:MAG: hypothetical protein CMD28_02875, partial [Flavobacteriales bacterium]|nr:hypothetical protein [Flavobacteriales bacterium]